MEGLQTQIASLQERQADYDNLQKRLKEFEKSVEESTASIQCSRCTNNLDGAIDRKSSQTDLTSPSSLSDSDSFTEVVPPSYLAMSQKCFGDISKLKLMETKRGAHEKRFERFRAISLLDNASVEDHMSKLYKFVGKQGKHCSSC